MHGSTGGLEVQDNLGYVIQRNACEARTLRHSFGAFFVCFPSIFVLVVEHCAFAKHSSGIKAGGQLEGLVSGL